MIDAGKTIDLLKLRMYNEWLYNHHVYDEEESVLHKTITKEVVTHYIDPLELSKDSVILDLGCGPGYFLDEMKEQGFSNITGVTLSDVDSKLCIDKGHAIKKLDFSFLSSKEGFVDESVDLIFMRHALEHSPYPIFTLIECNRVLKQGAKMYIEVPAPNCDRKFEFYPNHYSIMTDTQLAALLIRTGFEINKFNNLEFDVKYPDKEGKEVDAKEHYYCITVTKQKPLDIK